MKKKMLLTSLAIAVMLSIIPINISPLASSEDKYNLGTQIVVNSDNCYIDLSEEKHNEIEGKLFIGWLDSNGNSPKITDVYNKDDILYAQYIDCVISDNADYYIEGVQMRNSGDQQIRCIINHSDKLKNSLPEVIEEGVLELPSGISDNLEYGNAYTVGKNTVYPVVHRLNRFSSTNGITRDYFIKDISSNCYDEEYAFRGYIRFNDYNGIERIVYTEMYQTSILKIADYTYKNKYEEINSIARVTLMEILKTIENNRTAELAYYISPMSSKFDAEATEIRNRVLNSTDSVSVEGNIWYISDKGDNKNSGDSEASPWATTEALTENADKIKSGDAVLFERGGIYRGGFSAQTGVFYGAYGSGKKPCIYGSKSATGKWTEVEANIWLYEDDTFARDVGGIIFDDGMAVGNKKVSTDISDLTAPYDFLYKDGSIYLYMTQNPTSVHKSVEAAINSHLISVGSDVSDVVFDNLTVKYGGGHGIRTNDGAKRVTVQNCELGFIGGSILDGYGDGTVRYGNAIEFWCGIDTATVTNCWIYQIYDSGITHQGSTEYKAQNIKVSDCLIEYCGFGSIEYWHNVKTLNSLENIEYSNNVLRFAGYGYGAGREHLGYHITGNRDENDNYAINFSFKNNIFDIAAKTMFDIRSRAGTFPTLSGNTYAQYDGRLFGYYGRNIADAVFNENIDAIIKTFDKTCTVIHYEE